jgi:hypothetical protein
MPDSQNFNTNKDINRYLQQQGRAPQSHLDWETWRKIGQPGTYQAPPGSGQRFQGVSSGAGGPSYSGAGSNYNMFKNTGDAIASALAGPTSFVQNKFAKMGKGNSGSTASSRNDSDMADDNGSMNPPIAGGGRSQNASITSPSSSRGSRRSRGGDFSSTLSSQGIQMVQGNDNYGTIYGNMGGANVGGGSYDNSFQSKNTGGNQTAFSLNNNGSNNNPPPVGPPTTNTNTPSPPRMPRTPSGPVASPTTPNGTPQVGTPTRPQIPVGGPTRPQIPVGGNATPPAGQGPSNYGNTPAVGPQAPVQGPTSRDKGLMGFANDTNGGQETETARTKLTDKGYNGPWRSETTMSGPQAPAPSMLPAGAQQPMTSPVEGPANPASKSKGRKINEQGGVGARKYGPAKPKPAQGPVEGPKSGYAQVKERNQKNEGNKKAGPIGAAGEGTTAASGSKSTTKSTVKTMGKGKK